MIFVVAVSGFVFVTGIFCLNACSAMGSRLSGARLARAKKSRNWKNGHFTNPVKTLIVLPGSGKKMLSSFLFGKQRRRPANPLSVFSKKKAVHIFRQKPIGGLRLTWLGHAGVLIEIDGVTIIVDPVLSGRASPFTWVGPTPFFSIPLRINDLPNIDAVIISHDHYDHLDHRTIIALNRSVNLFIVPLGVGAHLEGWGVPSKKIIELDWWQKTTIGSSLKVVATPARHFSGRCILDRNHTLWASWVFVGSYHRVYFNGDTGPFSQLSRIAFIYSPFDVTLLPIGAYSEMWPQVHLNPAQAVAAHRVLRGKVLFPIHWGTFNLAPHSWMEPIEKLLAQAKKNDVGLMVPPPGRPTEIDEIGFSQPGWWQSLKSLSEGSNQQQ